MIPGLSLAHSDVIQGPLRCDPRSGSCSLITALAALVCVELPHLARGHYQGQELPAAALNLPCGF